MKPDRYCIQRFIISCILGLSALGLYSYLDQFKEVDKSSPILIILILVLFSQALINIIITIIDTIDDGINDTSILNIFSIILSGVVLLVTFLQLINPIIQFIIHDYKL